MLKGRRGPVIAGAIALVVVLLMIFFLVLPKMHSVSEAQTTLDTTQAENSTLQSQLEALRQAQAEAPKNRETIAKVEAQIPPTADLPGLLLLMQNAATRAGIVLSTMTPSTPVFNDASGLSEITVSYTVTGSYFALTEFLYNLETLPRAAKSTDVTINPGSGTGTSTSTFSVPTLSMTGSVILYTTDTSAGPGSVPGPTSASGSSASTTTVVTSPTPSPGA
jgi:Tfp pilus assembly protein PilO